MQKREWGDPGRSVTYRGVDYISKYIKKLGPGFPLSDGKKKKTTILWCQIIVGGICVNLWLYPDR